LDVVQVATVRLSGKILWQLVMAASERVSAVSTLCTIQQRDRLRLAV
jgi:hypothetical protein